MSLEKFFTLFTILLVPVILGTVFWLQSNPSFEIATAYSSVEVNTGSYSPSGPEGGVIIPASCPSYEHFPGECTTCTPSCGEWSACSVSCGGGTQSRTCTASDCSTYTDTQSCNNQPCLFTLSFSKTGTGSGTGVSSPSGINCGSTCSANFSAGSSVSLTATPGAGSSFAGWSGACSGTGTCNVLMNGDKSVTATFNNNPPSATNLSVSQPDYCASGPAAFFSWTFQDSGDTQSAYRVQVDNNSGFSSPEDDSGKVGSGSQNYATPLGKLSYASTYFWRLMVWDSIDQSSSWISGSSFATPAHAYPQINFTWTPSAPSQDEQTQFTDQSQVFGGSTKTAWSWTFQSGNPSSAAAQNPTTKFTSPGSKTITLRVTDSSGFACQGSKTLQAQLPLPEWEEIAPF